MTLGSGLRSPRLTHTLQIQLVFVAQASDDDDDKEDDGINNGDKKIEHPYGNLESHSYPTPSRGLYE